MAINTMDYWNNILGNNRQKYLQQPTLPDMGTLPLWGQEATVDTTPGISALTAGVGSTNPLKVTTPWYESNMYVGADGKVVQGMNPLTTGLGIANSLGQLWLGSQALELGEKNYNLQKGAAESNLYNQAQLLRAGLEDKARARHYNYGGTADNEQQAVASYQDKYNLRSTLG